MGSAAGFYCLLGLYILFSLIHLLFCFLEKEGCRRLTKGLCLPFLLGAVLCLDLNAYLLSLALLFGWLGDLCLLKKHKVYPFVLGVLCFLLNHAFYLAYMVLLLPSSSQWGVGLLAIWLLLPLVVFPLLHAVARERYLSFGLSFYASALLVELIAAGAMAYYGLTAFGYLLILGVISFILSDSFLGFTLFRKDCKRRDFYIMLLYLLAQALIAIPLALI